MGTDCNIIFLLGGYDLEMITIRDILDERGISYVDKALQWQDAFLSKYSKELETYSRCKKTTIYGIELKEDITLPQNYISIDHHNDKSSLLSSLEQVAKVLKYDMNQWQNLVAANDRGYIPAMIRMGASQEQINDIRKKDRCAQGIKEKDEILAENSLKQGLEQIDKLTKVKSLTNHFSIIADKLYPCNSLLIYTEHEWVYYGCGRNILIDIFQDYIRKGIVYFGGNHNGYIGLAKGTLPKEQINEMIKLITNRLRYV